METAPTPADPWDAVAAEYASRVEPFTSKFASPLLDLAGDDLEGRHLLDVAAGSGAVSVLAAVDRGMSVTAVDISAEMLNQLSSRPSWKFERSAGTAKLETVVASGEELPPEWTDTFDVATSLFGVIFFSDPVRGVREMLRVVKPGSQVIFSAWALPEQTEAFQIIPTAAASVLPEELVSSSKKAGPGKRIQGEPEALRALLAEAGAGDVMIHGPIARTLTQPSARAYWDRFALAAPGTRALLACCSAEQAALLRERVISVLEERFGVGNPVELDASAYLATGRKLTPFQAAIVGEEAPGEAVG